ncbi:MAG: TrbC/VirB2 family protein [Proteobacteria bacterium]|nr:TrbC/VirB2 family protein [Pseudomonadota bacterium]
MSFQNQSHWVRVLFYAMLAIAMSMIACEAWAADDNKVTIVLCNAITFFQGGVGKSIAIIIIISIAIMMFLGKITWGVAIAVAVGMGLMFGAESVVKFASGDDTSVCTNVKGESVSLEGTTSGN